MTGEHRPASEELFLPASGGFELAAALAGAVAAGAVVLTQRLAARLAYSEALGPPALPAAPVPLLPWAATAVALALLAFALRHRRGRLLGIAALPLVALLAVHAVAPIYPPWLGAGWSLRLFLTPYRPLVAAAVSEGFLAVAVLATLALAFYGARTNPAHIAHGSAVLASDRHLAEAGLLARQPGRGFVLGAWRGGGAPRLVVDASDQHTLIVIPPGGGKTSGPILTTLLSDVSASAFVIDPKGELWARSAGWRFQQGQRCLRFAPHSGRTLRWNCLAEIPRSEAEVKLVSTIAGNLLTYPASETESHWISAARNLFRALALHALYTEPEPSIAAVRRILNDPELVGGLPALFEAMLSAEHDPERARGWVDLRTGEPTTTHPEVAQLARGFHETPPKELGSIVSTLNQFLALWGDEHVLRATSTSDFSLREFARRSERTTLYVTLPFQDLHRLGPLIRIMLSLLMLHLTDDEEFEDHASTRRSPLYLLLDEFAALGRVPILEEMLAFLRGYGVRAAIALQDLNQLRAAYSIRESITGTCQVHLLAASHNPETRDHASRLAGEATVRYRRRTSSSGRGLFDRTSSVSYTEARRPLLTVGEIGALPADRLLLLKAGVPPALLWRHPYYADPVLRARAAVPPPGFGARA